MLFFQKTIGQEVSCSGIGIHSGTLVFCRFVPSVSDAGIRFIHEKTKKEIHIGGVVPEESSFATVLSFGSWSLSTVEHLLAVFYALSIDTITVFVDGDELPILDGSGFDFACLLKNAGIVELGASKRRISVREPLFLGNKNQSIFLRPCFQKQAGLIDLSISSDRDQELFLGNNQVHFLFKEDLSFLQEIIPARTFGRFDQYEYLLANGYGLGASLDNTLLFKDGAWVQKMRFKDEPIRHKVLDFVGDLMLLGVAFEGIIQVRNPSHSLNRLMVKHWVEHPDQWVLK